MSATEENPLHTPEEKIQCELKSENFTAVAALRSDGRRKVTVTGRLSCPSAGFKLRLETDNPGFNPKPNVLVLKVVEEEPDGVVVPVVTETEVSQDSSDFLVGPEKDTIEIRTLRIYFPIADG
ncbi:hypothetical protein ACGFZK_12010 [Streptomyces sp. NPDC048257]|uniref:hypothetical protein n=1 Tax=Streptomyces sp. NPDC048257 TaxID=3365526 RepID=UPI0037197C17